MELIMEAARSVLVSEGYSGFSVRKVAKEAGISIGHLQHFLPTKEKLLEALFEYVSGLYDRKYAELLERLPEEPQQRFHAITEYLIRDTCNQDTKTFFFEFWTASLHHESARTVVNKLHRHHREILAGFIGEMIPSLAPKEREMRALQIAATIDGLLVHLDEEETEEAREATVQALSEALMNIARNGR